VRVLVGRCRSVIRRPSLSNRQLTHRCYHRGVRHRLFNLAAAMSLRMVLVSGIVCVRGWSSWAYEGVTPISAGWGGREFHDHVRTSRFFGVTLSYHRLRTRQSKLGWHAFSTRSTATGSDTVNEFYSAVGGRGVAGRVAVTRPKRASPQPLDLRVVRPARDARRSVRHVASRMDSPATEPPSPREVRLLPLLRL
jgi:hypothetical protein